MKICACSAIFAGVGKALVIFLLTVLPVESRFAVANWLVGKGVNMAAGIVLADVFELAFFCVHERISQKINIKIASMT